MSERIDGTDGAGVDGAAARSGAQWVIEAAGQRAVLVEVGGGLRTYAVDGHEVVDGYGPQEVAPASAGQLLAPWPGRIRDGHYVFGGEAHQLPLTDPARHTAIHGLVNWSRWGLVEQSAEAVTLEFHLPAQAGYPWSLLLRVRWSVGPDGLRADHEVRNTSDQDAPFGFSAHPYFKLPGVAVDDALLQVPARIRALSDSRLLPIGTVKIAGSELDYAEPRRIGDAVLDVTFGDVEHEPDGSSTVRLTGPGGQPALAVWADGQFRWWQVFSADTLQGPRRRRAVAIEPMTCPPDAFRSGRDLTVLAPQQTWRGSWGVRPRLG